MNPFQPASRTAAKARVALTGPSGSGKTYTALLLATHLADRVAVIDTEHGSASTYAGLNGWTFDVVTPSSYAPTALAELLAHAADGGYGAVVIDSLSHYWMGADGMLEQVDKAKDKMSGWRDAGPAERRMIDAIIGYPGHVIATMRVKTEIVIEKDERTGKMVPRKVGLKPVQRDGVEHEFGVIGELDQAHQLRITKSRIPALSDQVLDEPGADLAMTIREWYEQGEDAPTAIELRDEGLASTDLDVIMALGQRALSLGLSGAYVTAADGSTGTLQDVLRGHWINVKADQRVAS